MEYDPPLSQSLLGDLYDREAAEKREHKDDPEWENTRRLVGLVIQHLVQSREQFLNKPLAAVEKLHQVEPEAVSWLVDDYLTREELKNIPRRVRRVLSLSQLETLRIPSRTTTSFLLEATRTYVNGLPASSITLCRAALEQALNSELGRVERQHRIDLVDLISEARKWHVLDDPTRDMADDIRRVGNDVLHGKVPTDASAFDILTKTRGILAHVFRAEGGYEATDK